jgi:hypothetical protein
MNHRRVESHRAIWINFPDPRLSPVGSSIIVFFRVVTGHSCLRLPWLDCSGFSAVCDQCKITLLWDLQKWLVGHKTGKILFGIDICWEKLQLQSDDVGGFLCFRPAKGQRFHITVENTQFGLCRQFRGALNAFGLIKNKANWIYSSSDILFSAVVLLPRYNLLTHLITV